jgi:hypothetical protein
MNIEEAGKLLSAIAVRKNKLYEACQEMKTFEVDTNEITIEII